MIYTTSREPFRKYTDPETFEKIVDYPTVAAMWQHSAAAYKDLPAILDDGRTFTYQDLDRDAAVLRAVLKKNGLEKGDRVGIYAANSYEFVKAYLAVVTAGMTAMILPIQLDETALFGCTMKYALKAVFYRKETEEKTTFAKTHGSRAAFLAIECGEAETLPVCGTIEEKDPAVIMFTGGTTGKSKGAFERGGHAGHGQRLLRSEGHLQRTLSSDSAAVARFRTHPEPDERALHRQRDVHLQKQQGHVPGHRDL